MRSLACFANAFSEKQLSMLISLCFRLLEQADVFVEQLCQASKGHLTKLLTSANWSGHHERNSHVYCLR
ncbi:hypothetical protein T07_14849 [Trichinella nelsoni]|uniref:Uncharacterized protein n=1 Tax=Trichinella nelsoni TaxID=6336 RepID=A0A0V0RTW5_9BILA|nr:hypothetical protein T07_14849 [Trichinella nelsoni]